MQVVGHTCELCAKPIVSGMDGVGCQRCERFFHDACVLAPPAPVEAPETYRVPSSTRAEPKRKSKVRCPGCGADVRKEQRERDRRATAEREANEETRRIAADERSKPMFVRYLVVRGVVALVVLFVLTFARLFLMR